MFLFSIFELGVLGDFFGAVFFLIVAPLRLTIRTKRGGINLVPGKDLLCKRPVAFINTTQLGLPFIREVDLIFLTIDGNT